MPALGAERRGTRRSRSLIKTQAQGILAEREGAWTLAVWPRAGHLSSLA